MNLTEFPSTFDYLMFGIPVVVSIVVIWFLNVIERDPDDEPKDE